MQDLDVQMRCLFIQSLEVITDLSPDENNENVLRMLVVLNWQDHKPFEQKVCRYVTVQWEAKGWVKTVQLPFKYIQTKLQEHHNIPLHDSRQWYSEYGSPEGQRQCVYVMVTYVYVGAAIDGSFIGVGESRGGLLRCLIPMQLLIVLQSFFLLSSMLQCTNFTQNVPYLTLQWVNEQAKQMEHWCWWVSP